MKYRLFVLGTLSVLLASQWAKAGVLDRSGQSIDILFADKPTVEIIHTSVKPSITGVDSLNQKTGSVSQAFNITQLNFKTFIDESHSLALIIDQPWGSDFVYADSSLLYGGTLAQLESQALTGLIKKQLNKRSSLFAGLRFQEIRGEFALDGLAYGPLAGYTLSSKKDWASGYVLGGSYAIKEYGARLSLTYHSEVEHTLDTQESISPTSTQTKIITPQSINIGLQTGIAPKTLLFSTFRWVDWSNFVFDPEALQVEVANFEEDLKTYKLGLVHQLTSNWLTTIIFQYEPKVSASNSLLQPSNGYKGVVIGTAYTFNKQLSIGGAYGYTQVGDASAQTQGGNSVNFEGNSTKAFNLRLRWAF